MTDELDNSWRDDIREKLRHQEAIVEALDDLAVPHSDVAPAWWADLRDTEAVTLYVLTPGLLHRFTGPRDRASGDERDSTCTYRALPITRTAAFSLSVSVIRGAERTRNQTRHWSFTFGEADEQSLSFAISAEHGEDATAFARALAVEIAGASALPDLT